MMDQVYFSRCFVVAFLETKTYATPVITKLVICEVNLGKSKCLFTSFPKMNQLFIENDGN